MLTSQPLTRIALSTVLSIGLLGGAFLIWPHVLAQQERQLVGRLISELEQSHSPESRVLLRQIASLGNSSLEALVMAAASERADIALQARQIIGEKLGTWKTTADVDSAFDLGQPTCLLASTLATQIDEFGPLGQQWSSSLALELVDLSGSLPAQVAAPLLADCGKILNHVPALGPRMRTLNPGQKFQSVGEILISTGGQPVPGLLNVPSERMISSKTTAPSLGGAENKRNATSPAKASEYFANSIPSDLEWSRSLSSAKPEGTPLEKSALSESKENLLRDQTRMGLEKGASQGSVVDVPSPDEMEKAIATLHGESTRTLLERLPANDFYTAGAIRLVLRERGFTDEELSVVDRLTSNDPADRLRLIRDLKVLPARSARRWLREFLKDNNAEVRLEALTTLATTNDPDLVGLAREMAVNDQDIRVSKLAARIMREAK